MKILVVTQYFWPENFQINDFVNTLYERGHQVTVLTGKPNYPEGLFYKGYGFFKNKQEVHNGINIIRVPLFPRKSGRKFHLFLNYLSFVFFASMIAPFRCRSKYDVIFVYEPSPITVGIPALLLKKIKRIPIIFWVQDLWPESLSATGAIRSPILLKLVRQMVYFIYHGCDIILVQSKKFFRPIEEYGIERDRIRYFPNSAESIYRPITLEEGAPERDKMPDGFRVMFAGNIGAAQDFETILDAAEKLKHHPDIHWLILGEGRMFNWLNEEVSKRTLHETFHLLGRHPAISMPRYFSLAHVMLVTLKKKPIFSLTVPSKVQSYLACGKPIIAALDGEGADIIREAGAGLAVGAEESNRLAEAVLKLYSMSEQKRELMGAHGREYFESNFQKEKLLTKFESWSLELIGG